MSNNSGQITKSQVAESVPFDNETNGFLPTSDNTQAAIEEVRSLVNTTLSPGVSAGRKGNSPTNTWLLGPGEVSTNVSNISINYDDPIIARVTCGTEDLNTYTLQIYEHEGDEINLTLLYTLTVTNSRNGDSGPLNIPFTSGRKPAFRIGSGNATEIVAQIEFLGDNS